MRKKYNIAIIKNIFNVLRRSIYALRLKWNTKISDATNVESCARFRRMPGLGDVMDCAELVTESVTEHACGQTDRSGGLLKLRATMVGV